MATHVRGPRASEHRGKVMHVDGLGFLSPGSPGVCKVANQLFLLGIDTDDRPAGGLKGLFLALDQLKLLLPFTRVRGTPMNWEAASMR